jgi:hypothetical protein
MKKLLPVCVAVLLCFSCGSLDSAPKYPNMVADMDPFSVGSVAAYFDRLFASQLKEADIEVAFDPRKNEVTLGFRHELINYRQYWNLAARQHFSEALNRYKEDFENRNLNLKFNKSKSVYGKSKSRIEWETFRFSATYRSSPVIEFGYRLKDEYAYFSISQLSAKEESEAMKSIYLESPQFTMHFSLSQGDDLAKLFDQNFLMGLVGESGSSVPRETNKDVYYRGNGNVPVDDTANL